MPRVFLFAGRPMHPLLRVLAGLAVLALVVLAVFFGAVILLVLAGVGAVATLVARWRGGRGTAATGPSATPHQTRVLEGEYVVVEPRDDHHP